VIRNGSPSKGLLLSASADLQPSSGGAVWSEPYFANFHPGPPLLGLVDRALADKSKPFDGLPFRIKHLLYAVVGASLLIPLYRIARGSSDSRHARRMVYAVHPIHTEVVRGFSARKDLNVAVFYRAVISSVAVGGARLLRQPVETSATRLPFSWFCSRFLPKPISVILRLVRRV